MKLSHSFLKTQKEFPKDETAVNARLLMKANYVEKLMAGVYSLLPLGWRVARKIQDIIREEMDNLGAEELFLPALHPRVVWDKTGRWQALSEIMYQFKDRFGRELGLGPTHEEIITAIAAKIINSYKDLPRYVYQIQTKFRDEPRAKAGLLRGREFTMKDLYSFHADKASLDGFYEEVKKAYFKIFRRCGLKAIMTEASGGVFSKEFSHEFMVETPAGEDEIIYCRKCQWAQNVEIAQVKEGDQCPGCKKDSLSKLKTIEVGNIFRLGAKFSEPLGLFYKDSRGENRPVIMGSYGIGIERLMGTIVEVNNDNDGIIWPAEVSPFDAELVLLSSEKSAKGTLQKFGEKVYNDLVKNGLDIFYDDRTEVSAGEKLKDADLLGISWRLVVSEKTLKAKKIELKKRADKKTQLVSVGQAVKTIK